MTAILVDEASRVGEARRAVQARAARLGWSESDAGAVALLATEAGTNLVKHAGGGTILFGSDGDRVMDLLVLDHGPGLRDPRSLIDGVSSTGTAGLGLGSLHRVATTTDLFTGPRGTAIYLRYAAGRAMEHAVTTAVAAAGVTVPKPGEETCGDGLAIHSTHGRTLAIVCDGLGHGQAARDAAQTVLSACASRLGRELPDMIESAHAAARHTRGAAALLVEIDPGRGLVRCCGVGNVAGQVIGSGRAIHLVSNNGTLGAEIRRVQEFSYPWDPDSTLIMHSDGLQQRWHLDDYPGWRHRHPMLVAGLLFRDCARGRDDAAVLVARGAGHGG